MTQVLLFSGVTAFNSLSADFRSLLVPRSDLAKVHKLGFENPLTGVILLYQSGSVKIDMMCVVVATWSAGRPADVLETLLPT